MAWDEKARAVGSSFAPQVARVPMAHTFVLLAVDFLQGPNFEVVVAGARGAPDTRAMLDAVDRAFLPNKVVVLRPSEDAAAVVEIAPYARDQVAIGGAATAYVCRNFSCDLPTTRVSDVIQALGGVP
jgi:uncharacterized protein YyaL (SSP411 family)